MDHGLRMDWSFTGLCWDDEGMSYEQYPFPRNIGQQRYFAKQ
jgi:hypothetical protein